MKEQLALLPGYLTQHLQLTLVALGVGMAISIPLGIVATRRRWVERVVLGIASVVQTIPSLALLAVMVPVLAALGTVTSRALGVEVRAIGYLPAIIGLTLYSLLPILRNTHAGIRGVDPALTEAARGTGMTPRQELQRVLLPLAMPVIVAGIRTSTVWVVGMATLSTPVGAPSLGNYIFTGLQTRNNAAVLVGCAAAAALALLLDTLIRGLEDALRRRRSRAVRLWLALLGSLVAYTAASFAWTGGAGAGRPLRIGGKPFTEQYILSELLALHVRAETRLPTEVVQSLGSTVAFDALRSGDLDAYVEYTGTLWTTILKRQDVPPRAEVMREVGRQIDRRFGVHLVGALGFENAYCLAMRRAAARALGVQRLSELGPRSRSLSIGADYEFFGRAEWASLRRTYGLSFREQRTMDPSLLYEAAGSGEVDVISAYTTDGRIRAFALQVLEDDRRAIPPYDAVVLVSDRLAREHPEAVQALHALDGAITAERMREMNQSVDGEGKSAGEVAREFLARAQLP